METESTFVVFYNGLDCKKEKYVLKLSDAFANPTEDPQVELICHVYNINEGNNQDLMNNCKFLKEYMILVDYVRYYQKEKSGTA